MIRSFSELNENTSFLIFIGVVMFDIVLGTLSAIVNKKANSRVNKNGITKHISIILLVGFCTAVFKPLGFGDLTSILIYFYIGSYMLSILENLESAGVPLPKWLVSRFEVLRGQNDEIERRN